MSLKEMVDSLVEEPRYKINKRDLKFNRFEKQEKFNFDIPQTTDGPPEHYGRNKVSEKYINRKSFKKQHIPKNSRAVIEDLPKSSITGKFVDDYFSRNSKKLPTPKLFFISVYTSSPIVANECYTQLRPIIKGSNKVFPYTQVKSVIDIGVVGSSKNDALEILDSYLKQTGISKSTYTTKICN
jgi:hypothetical protein